jgi:gluconokinase
MRQPREDAMERRDARGPIRAIIVMGVAGSGKTTLASLLAEKLDCGFLEGDDYHSEANVAKMRGGKPLTDEDRWPWLDALGAAVARSIATNGFAVASCSALRRVYRDRLRASIGPGVLFVLLEADAAELTRRLNDRAGHYMPASLLGSQLATLERPQADEDALDLRTDRAPALLAEQVLNQLAERRPSPDWHAASG